MSRLIRIRRSAEQWRSLIDDQASSGLSQVAFCKREKIAPSSFAKWKRKLSTPGSKRQELTPDLTPWIDLGPLGSQPKPSAWDIELDLGGGVCLRLRRR